MTGDGDDDARVRAVIGARELTGPGWRLATQRPVGPSNGTGWWPGEDGWATELGVRRGLTLRVTGSNHEGECDVAVEAWAGEPDDSEGVAVVSAADGHPALALALVPLCRCGDRGCGNSSVQLDKQVTPAELPELVSLLRELPWTTRVPSADSVLRGDALAALEPRADR